ncbi:NfeD family protein [Dyella sp. 2RAB6]|uniref:NfeD family protein n=1 Tax=Dyella sp. 2RAB6 TaxID=3232992 RepID=UPI003F8F58EC
MFAEVATHYLWWIVALLLIGAEVLLPGYFLLWIGLGAAATGLLVWVVPLPVLGQATAFVLLAFLSCAIYWYQVRPRLRRQDRSESRLNRRGEQNIGRQYVLAEAIVNGRGKARVGDGLWLVSGPDLPVGTTVEVVAVEGNTLQVKPAA